jgi:5-methylcytosine-specific restriction endonuclease McrA
MSDTISARLARRVRRRARGACEYCRLPQWTQEATFHIDHIQPRADGGRTAYDNFALACVSCSLKKAARTLARDPDTGTLTPLFQPRKHIWSEHFHWTKSWRLQGLTPTGRATIKALGMNRPGVVRIRRVWASVGKFGPPS